MKRIKLNFAIVAMVLGLTAAFGFKAPVKQNQFNDPFWQYNGMGDPTLAVNYTLLEGSPDCEGLDITCAIEAPASADPSKPVINTDLAGRITHNDTSDGDVFLAEAN